jgi:hypothetical protein
VYCSPTPIPYAWSNAQRGRSKAAWFVWGGLFYPLPYIALALLPLVRKETVI